MTVQRRAVIAGGTFDPIHCGHLEVARQARLGLSADEIWLLPAGDPPHRRATASAADRLAMVEAAATGDPLLRVLDLEVRRPGPSYTVDTLVTLEAEHPEVEQWFLVGADAAREIRTWHHAVELLRLARFAIVNRRGEAEMGRDEALALGFDPTRTRLIRVDSPPVSATAIRSRAAAGLSLRGLVPPEVEACIARLGLYRHAGAVG